MRLVSFLTPEDVQSTRQGIATREQRRLWEAHYRQQHRKWLRLKAKSYYRRAKMKEHIIQYTSHEGGLWLNWPDDIDNTIPLAKDLDAAKKEKAKIRHRSTVEFEKPMLGVSKVIIMRIHSFRTDKDRRWDCFNGWTELWQRTRQQQIADTVREQTLAKIGR